MLTKLLICVNIIWAISAANGEPTSHYGREFLISFIENRILATFPVVRIQMTSLSQERIRVEVSMPLYRPGTLDTYILEPLVTVTHDYPSDVHMSGSGQGIKGVQIISSGDIAVQAGSVNDLSSDSYVALPTPALGTTYYVMSYLYSGESTGHSQGPTEFGIVGVSDGTIVNITFPHPDMNPFLSKTKSIEVAVDRLTTFHVQSYLDLTGTRIHSSSPVAVISGTVWTSVSAEFMGDHLVEQMLPASSWGQEFIMTPIATRTTGDIFRVLAKEHATNVQFLDETAKDSVPLQISLGEGEFQDFDANAHSAYHVFSNKPILLAQFCKSHSADDRRRSDPFMTLVPHVDQWLDSYSFVTFEAFTTSDPFDHYVNLIGHYPDALLITLNDTEISSTVFVTNWTTLTHHAYMYATVRVPTGRHILGTAGANTSFGGILYGLKFQESYGHSLGQKMSGGESRCVRVMMTAGDGFDNDCDGRVDEEVEDGKDNDGDGAIDEDLGAVVTTTHEPTTTTLQTTSKPTTEKLTTQSVVMHTHSEVTGPESDYSTTTTPFRHTTDDRTVADAGNSKHTNEQFGSSQGFDEETKTPQMDMTKTTSGSYRDTEQQSTQTLDQHFSKTTTTYDQVASTSMSFEKWWNLFGKHLATQGSTEQAAVDSSTSMSWELWWKLHGQYTSTTPASGSSTSVTAGSEFQTDAVHTVTEHGRVRKTTEMSTSKGFRASSSDQPLWLKSTLPARDVTSASDSGLPPGSGTTESPHLADVPTTETYDEDDGQITTDTINGLSPTSTTIDEGQVTLKVTPTQTDSFSDHPEFKSSQDLVGNLATTTDGHVQRRSTSEDQAHQENSNTTTTNNVSRSSNDSYANITESYKINMTWPDVFTTIDGSSGSTVAPGEAKTGLSSEVLLMILLPLSIIFGLPLMFCCFLTIYSSCHKKKRHSGDLVKAQPKPERPGKQKACPGTFTTAEYQQAVMTQYHEEHTMWYRNSAEERSHLQRTSPVNDISSIPRIRHSEGNIFTHDQDKPKDELMCMDEAWIDRDNTESQECMDISKWAHHPREAVTPNEDQTEVSQPKDMEPFDDHFMDEILDTMTSPRPPPSGELPSLPASTEDFAKSTARVTPTHEVLLSKTDNGSMYKLRDRHTTSEGMDHSEVPVQEGQASTNIIISLPFDRNRKLGM